MFNQTLWDHQGHQLTDATGRFLADIPGTSALLGEPLTPYFITHEMTFVLQGLRFRTDGSTQIAPLQKQWSDLL